MNILHISFSFLELDRTKIDSLHFSVSSASLSSSSVKFQVHQVSLESSVNEASKIINFITLFWREFLLLFRCKVINWELPLEWRGFKSERKIQRKWREKLTLSNKLDELFIFSKEEGRRKTEEILENPFGKVYKKKFGKKEEDIINYLKVRTRMEWKNEWNFAKFSFKSFN